MSSWDDLFVILNEAKKSKKEKDNDLDFPEMPEEAENDELDAEEIEVPEDAEGEDTLESPDGTTDEFGDNEFADDLPEVPEGEEVPDENGLDDMEDPEMMDMDGAGDDLGGDPEDIEDPDGFSAMEDELGELEPEDKERKAYIFKILVKTINVAKIIQSNFISDKNVDTASKELEQINRLIELLTYYKKYKFDALTEFEEIEGILKKSAKVIEKIAKRLVSLSNKNDKKNKK